MSARISPVQSYDCGSYFGGLRLLFSTRQLIGSIQHWPFCMISKADRPMSCDSPSGFYKNTFSSAPSFLAWLVCWPVVSILEVGQLATLQVICTGSL
ncbi:hypothetical protein AHF37_12032 [Paragonimus kellicotti]|nr:hypothetical protein AHF37_12032 [Paragonimus kellicotti]